MREDKIVPVSLHHQVLIPWADLASQLPEPPRVLSLDFHTDTLSAADRGLPMPEPGCFRRPEAVRSALKTLHHDEHFDWALRTGMISRAVILSISPQTGPLPHPGLCVLPFSGTPPVQTILNDPESARGFADDLLSRGLPDSEKELAFTQGPAPWILDIDCDVFLTEKALEYPEDGLFAGWVRRAALITFSKESDWVKLLRLPGENMTGERIASELCRKFNITRKDI